MIGNTPAVAKRAYVDPRVVDAYHAGSTIDAWLPRVSSLAELSDRRRGRVELAVLDLLGCSAMTATREATFERGPDAGHA